MMSWKERSLLRSKPIVKGYGYKRCALDPQGFIDGPCAHPYYENLVPENLDNLKSDISQNRRPTIQSIFQENYATDDGKLPYYETWHWGPTVTSTRLDGEPFRFLRGGLACKTRGGPQVVAHRRVRNNEATTNREMWVLHKIKFPGNKCKGKF